MKGPASALRRLPAKISTPSGHGLLPRPRLFARLHDARSAGRHMWIVAPAGSGKTALVASFCDTQDVVPIWYRFDECDGDAGGFLHYFACAVQARVRQSRARAKPLDPALAKTPAAQRMFLRKLLAEVPGGTLIVLDDYHLVPGGSEVQGLLGLTLEEVTPDVTIALTSRSLPEGVLARAFANGSLIDRDDLRLSADEAQVIAGRAGIAAASTIESALELSRGWASGFILLLRASGRTELPSPGSLESPKLVADFLAAEIFPQLDAHEKMLLTRCAFLPVVTESAANRLSHSDDASHVLRGLHERQLFVDRLRDSEAYVFHPLVRAFLADNAASTLDRAALTELKIASADIMEESGEDAELPELLASIGAWDRLVNFVERNASRFVTEGRSATLERYIRRLPADELDGSPWCRYWLGMCLAHRDMTAAHEQFEAARAKMLERGDDSGASDATRAALDALFWEWRDDAPPVQNLLGDVLGEVLGRANRLLPQFRGLLFGGFAMLTAEPAHPITRGLIKQAETLYRESSSAALRAQAATMLVAAYNIQGDHPQASAVTAEAAALGESDDVPIPIRLYWQTGVALQHWYIEGDADAALRVADRAFELVRKTHASSFEHFVLAQKGCAHALRGELEEAERVLHQMRSHSGRNRRMETCRECYLRGAIQLRRGEFDRACETFATAVGVIERLPIFFVFSVQHRLALVQGLLAARRFEHALEQITKVHAAADRAQSAWFRWQALIAEAEAELALGRHAKADHALASALILGRTKGILSLPLMAPERLPPLLDRALSRGIETDFVHKLAARHGVQRSDSKSEQRPWRVRIYTLGRFDIAVDDAPLSFGRKAQQRPLDLVQAVIAHGIRDVPSSALQDALWPDAEGDAAEKAFGITLLRTRRLLNHEGALVLRQRKLSLNEALCWTDVQELERVLAGIHAAPDRNSLAHPRDAKALAERMLDLYRGPFLASEDEQPWMSATRARLRQRVSTAMAALARELSAQGDGERANLFCRALADRDPLTEDALRQWIELTMPSQPDARGPSRNSTSGNRLRAL